MRLDKHTIPNFQPHVIVTKLLIVMATRFPIRHINWNVFFFLRTKKKKSFLSHNNNCRPPSSAIRLFQEKHLNGIYYINEMNSPALLYCFLCCVHVSKILFTFLSWRPVPREISQTRIQAAVKTCQRFELFANI